MPLISKLLTSKSVKYPVLVSSARTLIPTAAGVFTSASINTCSLVAPAIVSATISSKYASDLIDDEPIVVCVIVPPVISTLPDSKFVAFN